MKIKEIYKNIFLRIIFLVILLLLSHLIFTLFYIHKYDYKEFSYIDSLKKAPTETYIEIYREDKGRFVNTVN